MAIQTTLQPRFLIQRVFVILLCLVFGLWGCWDYFVSIPAKQQLYARGVVYRAVNDALGATDESAFTANMDTATQAVSDALGQLAIEGIDTESEATPTTEQMTEALNTTDDVQWRNHLVLMSMVLQEKNEKRVPPFSDRFNDVYNSLKNHLAATAEISEPGKYDRLIKGALFIPCLPFAFWYMFTLARQRKEVFTLEDDGSITTPSGVWAAEDIADIDMSKWMLKSVAFVVHQDGRRLKLDDFFFKNVHLIVGQLASERYPDDWTEEAKAPTAEEPETPDDETPGAEDADTADDTSDAVDQKA